MLSALNAYDIDNSNAFGASVENFRYFRLLLSRHEKKVGPRDLASNLWLAGPSIMNFASALGLGGLLGLGHGHHWRHKASEGHSRLRLSGICK
jgi:hypothetical protein